MADPELQQLAQLRAFHEASLGHALNGDFAKAHEGFGTILRELGGIALTVETFLPATLLQADALRDDAYTSLRQGLRNEHPELFARAASGLQEARDVTKTYVSGDIAVDSRTARSLFASQAMTETLEGQLVVSTQLFHRELGLFAPATEEQRKAQFQFGLAHKTAMGGNSAYAGASNAMRGARAEVINASPKYKVAENLRRAAMFATVHEAQGFQDRRAAVRTIVNRSRDLRSREAAIRSALDWRRV